MLQISALAYFTYFDDIFVISASFADRLVILKQMSTFLQSAGIKVSVLNYDFDAPHITFLGCVFHKKAGHSKKRKAIQHIMQLTAKKHVRPWIHSARFCRRFVPRFSRLAALLQEI